jgi:putative flippase GtrA
VSTGARPDGAASMVGGSLVAEVQWEAPKTEGGWHVPSQADNPPEQRLSFLHRPTVRRFVRYGSVSAISTSISLIVLGVLVGILNTSAIWANVIATTCATVPSFELNRRWVWAESGQRSLVRQALPYCLCSFAGLLISTLAVHLASDATGHSSRLIHTAAVEAAVIGSYGALWLVQFVLCDRILFRSRTRPAGSTVFDDRSEEAPRDFARSRTLETV